MYGEKVEQLDEMEMDLNDIRALLKQQVKATVHFGSKEVVLQCESLASPTR